MAGVSRRDFLQQAGGASAALAFMVANGITLDASPLGLPIGSQMWPHRARIGTDGYDGLAAVLKDLKAIGIEIVELVSPSGEFQALTDGKQVRKILDDNGIKSPSAHFRGVRTNLPTLIQWAHDIGMTHMSMASMSGPLVNGVTTLEAVKRTCDEYNKLGAIAKKEGLQMMTHNEGFENSRLERRPTDVSGAARVSRSGRDEDAVPDVVDAHRRRPDHVLHDVPGPVRLRAPAGREHDGRHEPGRASGVDGEADARAARGAGSGTGRASRWGRARGGGPVGAGRAAPVPARRLAAAVRGALAVGEDTVDWVKVFQAAKIGGLKNYFVEQDWETTVRSVAFLKTLNVT